MATDEKALTIREPGRDALSILSDDPLIQLAAMAERRVEAIKTIRMTALKATSPGDWVDEGGKPYLQASGAEKVRTVFGISWRVDPPVRHDEEDGHFRYEYKGTFVLGASEIEVVGSRRSRDAFFAMGPGKVPKAIIDIDPGDVQKAAFSNCISNGMTRLLGIRNLSWAELEKVGITREGAGRVEFSKRGQEISAEGKNLRDEIAKMALAMVGGDKVRAADVLAMATEFTGRDGKLVPGKRSFEQVSEAALKPTYGRIKELWKAYDDAVTADALEAGKWTPEFAVKAEGGSTLL